jgi:hypothetical protein
MARTDQREDSCQSSNASIGIERRQSAGLLRRRPADGFARAMGRIAASPPDAKRYGNSSTPELRVLHPVI